MTDGRMLAYLDGELPETERVETAHHLRRCPDCLRELESLRTASGRLAEALAVLDVPVPAVDPDQLRWRHRSRARSGGGRVGRSTSRRETSRRALLAASIMLVAVTGALAALPGSPVRAWLVRSVERVAAALGSDPASPAATATEGVQDRASAAGVVIDPADGNLRVVLTAPSPDAEVRVRFVDDARATVRAETGRYRTAAGRVEVVGAGGEVRIDLPRSAVSVRVEVDGRTVLEKSRGDIRLLAPEADSSGSEIFFRPGG